MTVETERPELNPAYVTDASGFTGWAEAVFAPRDEAALIEVLCRASEQRIPITIAGAGSGLTGARVAQGGWVLSLEHFRRLDIGSGRARAGAAITLIELRQAAARTRQFYAPDPTELTACVGGTIATNASGSRSFRFGSTRRHVLGLRAAFIDGRVVEYRRGDKVNFDVPAIPLPNTTKNTAGYRLEPGLDWIDLLCGSEGTLGIVLEAELALLPVPEKLFSGVVFFGSDDEAIAAVESWRRIGDLRMLEYADRNSLDLLRGRYPEIPSPASAALLIEVEGENVDAWESRLSEASAMLEASWFATTDRDRERFRMFRHALPETVNATVLERGFMKMGTDYAVPIERNREMLAYYRKRLERELPGQYVLYGHIGDAHVHANMLPATREQAATATSLLTEFARQAVALGGTVSAEHGLGKRKAHLLAIQYAPEHIEAMVKVKRRLDPQWLLGRGTLFPVPDEFR
jgi:FAD/FMN-containing dehydrogenase